MLFSPLQVTGHSRSLMFPQTVHYFSQHSNLTLAVPFLISSTFLWVNMFAHLQQATHHSTPEVPVPSRSIFLSFSLLLTLSPRPRLPVGGQAASKQLGRV